MGAVSSTPPASTIYVTDLKKVNREKETAFQAVHHKLEREWVLNLYRRHQAADVTRGVLL
jgi:hypothetical protein